MDSDNLKPGVITKIETQKKNPERVSLYIDGEFRFGFDKEILSSHQLQVGAFLTAEIQQAILEKEEFRRALVYAYRALARRAYSSARLREKLLQKDFHESVAVRVISRLRAENYLDDRAFALAFCRSRLLTKPMGEMMLLHELKFYGIERSIAEDIADIVFSATSEEELAHRALRKKEKTYSRLDEKIAEKKKIQLLKNRGFSWDTIRKVLHC